MKTLRSEQWLKDAARLNQVIQQRKALEKEEKQLKSIFMSELENSPGMLKVGRFGILVKEMQRTIVSNDLILLNFGADGLKSCQTVSKYNQLEIVEEASAEKEA